MKLERMTREEIEQLATQAAHTYGNDTIDAMPVFTKNQMMGFLASLGYERDNDLSNWVYREEWDNEKGEMVKLEWNYVHLFKLYMSEAILITMYKEV